MARFTGYRCDWCKTVADGSGRNQEDTPIGWITVNVKTVDSTDASFKMVCSSDCLFKFASERRKVEREEAQSERAAAKAKKMQITSRMDHVRQHLDSPDPDNCIYCRENIIEGN